MAQKHRKTSEDQLREYDDAFQMFDKKNKGYISMTQIGTVIRSLGFNPTDAEFQYLCMTADYDGNNKLNFEEFVDLLEQMKKPEKEEETYRESFRAFDTENKGYVHASELRETILHVMEKCPERDQQNLLKVFRLNEDRQIKFEEFKNIIAPSHKEIS